MQRPDDGFSLIEMLIVLAVLATLSAMIVPNYLSARASANESAVVSTLKTIATAQNSFKTRVLVDRDLDGEGEFGYIGELCGAVPPRGGAAPIKPIVLGDGFRVIHGGAVNRSGYLFRMTLPARDGSPVNEAPDGGEDPANPSNQEMAEATWVCYAWPSVRGATGVRAFVINQAGDVLATQNDGPNQEYGGLDQAPAADAAFTVPSRITAPLAVNKVGNDEGYWTSLR